MHSKLLWFLAAVLVSGNAAADTLHYRGQPERGRTWLIEAERRPPGVAIGPHGEAVVTSNVLPVLWKIDAETLAVSVHRLQLGADTDKDVGFSGLVYRDGAYFAVSELQGSRWRIDARLRRAEKIAASEELRGTCTGAFQ